MAEGLPVDRLRQYLRELKPGSRALLIAELERAILRGDAMNGAEMVLQELRRSIRETGRQSQRIGNLARLFFQPLEPFLVDDAADHAHCGRIARVALEPIWLWISRDVLPGEAKAISDDISRVLIENDTDSADNLARNFQDRAVARMEEALATAASDEKARRKLVVQIGTPRAIEDIEAICGALKARDALDALAGRLPGHIRDFADAELDAVKALLGSAVFSRAGIFLFALVLVMSRLAARWQLVRLAVLAAGSDDVARIKTTPYAVAVTIVLTETARMVKELRNDLKSGRGVAIIALMRDIHDAMRGIRTELDVAPDSDWGRQLASIRAEIAEILRSDIESMGGRVRRLLRVDATRDIVPGSSLPVNEIEETESLIEFVMACRTFASELAVLEVSQRAFSELEQFFDHNTSALMDLLRHAGDADREFRLSQIQASIRFCGKLFGTDYATLLQRSLDGALSQPRKSARG